MYNAAVLARHLKTGRKNVPHTRRQLTPAEYEDVMYKAGRIHRGPYQGPENHGPPLLQYSEYQSRTAYKKMSRRHQNGGESDHPQFLQTQHAVALVGKIRKRIDALLGRKQREMLDDSDPSLMYAYIHGLEDLSSHVKKIKDGGVILEILTKSYS